MQSFEYKAIPAPSRGAKAKGAKTTEDRFAIALTNAINEMAAQGWDYVRAETLPCNERRGLTGTTTTFQNLLIFRRRSQEDSGAVTPLKLDTTEHSELPLRREPIVARKSSDTA